MLFIHFCYMDAPATPLLSKSARILIVLFGVIAGLYFAKPLLVPIAFAGILSMLFIPLSERFEKKMNRGLAALLCILLFLGVLAGIIALVSWQISDLTTDAGQIEKRVGEILQKLRQTIVDKLGISEQSQQELIKKQSSSQGGIGSVVTSFMASLAGIITSFVLMLVYIFLFMYLRTHLKNFIMKVVSHDQRQHASQTIKKASRVAQKYLTGLALMIVSLWIMYGIAFSIIGVKNALFFAVLCGLLEIVPFVGNITGTLLTIMMVITQGGGNEMIIGIIITYFVIQFFQTYILEPLVVGSEVNINPLFTILGIVAGEMIWGIPGMVLAIPVLGILKIIFENIPSLTPYGYLIGTGKKDQKSKGMFQKIKALVKKS